MIANTVKKSGKLPIIAVSLGFFMVIMDVTIVNVALPVLSLDLKSSVSHLQWVVDGYTLTFACFLLTAGYFSDLFGAKKIFIGGISGFILTSLGCGLAPTVIILIIFRLLQGLFAALLIPTSLALIHNSYTEEKARSHAVAIWASLGGVAAACGPVLGGILINYYSWRSVFLVNIPLGIMAIYLSYIYTVDTLSKAGDMPEGNLTKYSYLSKLRYKRNSSFPIKQKAHFDIFGQLFLIISIAALAFGLIEAPNLSWSSIWTIMAFTIFGFTLVLFLIIESRINHPMIDLNLFRSANFSVSALLGILLNFGFYGFLFVMPLYLDRIKHFSTLQIGFALFPLTVLMFFGNVISGKISGKHGPRFPVLYGFIINVLAFLILLILVYNNLSYNTMIFPFLLIGLAVSLIMPALIVVIIGATPHDKVGFASAMFNASRQLGSLLGVAVFGAIIGMTSNLILGLNVVLSVTVLIYILSVILTIHFIHR